MAVHMEGNMCGCAHHLDLKQPACQNELSTGCTCGAAGGRGQAIGWVQDTGGHVLAMRQHTITGRFKSAVFIVTLGVSSTACMHMGLPPGVFDLGVLPACYVAATHEPTHEPSFIAVHSIQIGIAETKIARTMEQLYNLQGPFYPESLDRQLIMEVYRRTDINNYQRAWIDHQHPVMKVSRSLSISSSRSKVSSS